MKGEKLFITFAIIGALFAVYFLIIRKLNKSDREKAKEEKKAESEIEDKAEKATGIAAFPAAYYETLANRIFIAMKGLGTNEKEVINVIDQLSSNRDAGMLDAAFGIRQNESLGSWLLSDGEALNVELQMQKNGLNYTFSIIDLS